MTPSTPSVSSYPETSYLGKGLVIKHRVRMEVEPENRSGKVNVASIFMELVKTIETAANSDVHFYDVHDKVFSSTEVPSMKTFKKDFLVTQTEGQNRKIIVGFYLESVVPFSTLKSRIGTPWFNQRKIFLRIHPLDFKWGIELHLLGYLINEHPYTSNLSEVAETVNQHLNAALLNYRNDDAKDKEKVDQILSLQDFFANGSVTLPLGLVRTTEKFVPPAGGAKVDAELLQVYVPKDNNWMPKFLVDRALLVDQNFPDFVPFALKKENPKLFSRWMAKQVHFMEQHRNIQLRTITALKYMETSPADQPTLEILLENHPDVHRVYTDFNQERIHISTTAPKYASLCQWLDSELAKYSFDVSRFSRAKRTSTGSYPSSIPPGVKSGKYSAFFSIPDDDVSLGVSTIVSTRTNPWKRRPPLELVCDLTMEAFPPLPAAAKPYTGATVTTQVSTLGETDIQQRIDDAIQKAEAQMEQKLKALQHQLDEQVKAYQTQLDTAISEMVTKTLESLAGDQSPFTTKADYAKMEAKFSELTSTTTAIWELLSSKSAPDHNQPARSPPRQAKRANLSTTPLRGEVTPHHRPPSPEPMDEEGGQI